MTPLPTDTHTMKIRVERTALTDALTWVARALPKNPSIPVLTGVRISASEGVVCLSAFDYDTQHTAAIEATVGDDGQCVAPGLFLRAAITGARGAEVDLILSGAQLEVASGRSTYRARCYDESDAPNLPKFPKVQGVVDADRLRDAVAILAPAINDDMTTFPGSRGIHIEGTADTLSLVATDRYRFHAIDLPWRGDEPFEVTIPGRSMVEAVKGMAEGVEVAVDNNLFGLSDGRRQWTTRRNGHEYIDWRRVVALYNEKCSESISTDLGDLLAAVKQVGSLTENERPIVVSFEGDELIVGTPQQEQGEGSEVLTAEGGSPVAIATNPRYLADALAVTEGPVEIRYGGDYSKSGAFIVADTSNPDVTLIVMSKSMPGGTK